MVTTQELLTQYRQKFGAEPSERLVGLIEALQELQELCESAYQRGLRDGRKEKIRSEEAE